MARHFTRSMKKAKLWTSIPGIQFNLTADATVAGSGNSFTSPQTVLRMMGEYIISSSAAPAANDSASVTVGIAKVSTDAFTLGASALPDPAGEASFPWLYWAAHPFAFEGTGIDTSLGVGALRHRYDVKTMRKFNANESLVVVVQYADIVGTPPLRIVLGQTRVLTTLH